ncbi:hypothetical protein CDL15_Pgr026178 [Punica granatum]|uniref:Uncharacterized protein n=1 Tax=Punica granatum TaxID=22663 RepID=A0A218VR37_PUNGR|nr:hypothetical protein CDL15_Pgr026178 [Punica granatum]
MDGDFRFVREPRKKDDQGQEDDQEEECDQEKEGDQEDDTIEDSSYKLGPGDNNSEEFDDGRVDSGGDDLANIQVTPPDGIAFRPPPMRPSMMPHPRAPITKETIKDIRTFLIHINLGLSRSYNGKGQRDGYDVTKDQTDVTEDPIDVTRDEFDVSRDELDLTRDEFNVTRDEFDVTRDELDVTKDELDETRDELDVTRDKFDVTRDEFDVTRDEFDVTFFSGTQMMQLA